MEDIFIPLKHLLIRLLPESLLRRAKKIHYARTLRNFTEQEEPDLMIVRDLVKEGDCVVDLGANIGVYTKFLSTWVGPGGGVYSVEPIPLTFDILKSNVAHLKLANVELLGFAISDSVGVANMEVPDFEKGGKNYYQAHMVAGEVATQTETYTVKTTTVDNICSPLAQKISFIKCDVEGQELSCINGALDTIQSSHPAWLIELSIRPDDPQCRGTKLSSILAQHGYEVYWFDGTELKEFQPGDKSVNYFFLTPEHLRLLRSKGRL